MTFGPAAKVHHYYDMATIDRTHIQCPVAAVPRAANIGVPLNCGPLAWAEEHQRGVKCVAVDFPASETKREVGENTKIGFIRTYG